MFMEGMRPTPRPRAPLNRERPTQTAERETRQTHPENKQDHHSSDEAIFEEILRRRVLEARDANKTLIMITRLRNPTIQAQLRSVAEQYRGLFTRDPDTVIQKIHEALDREETVTRISTKRKVSDSMYIPLLNKALIGIKNDPEYSTNEAREYVEAHEKGHAIRVELFMQGKLFENLTLSKEMRKGLSRWKYVKERAMQFFVTGSFAAQIALHIDPASGLILIASKYLRSPYLFSGAEIYERMSQLKNYFGINDATVFTADHLKYARAHYVSDTGADNNMTQFLNSITSKREGEFLRIMNTFGV